MIWEKDIDREGLSLIHIFMMSNRIAYYKVYHPVEFYAVYFTTKVAYFDEKVILKGIDSIENRMEEIIRKGQDASKKEEDELPVLEVAYEMCSRGYEFSPARLGISDSCLLYTSKKCFLR